MGETVEFKKSSSFLLAEGKRGAPARAWFALSAALLVCVAAALGMLWFSLSRPLPIPASPVLLLSSSPKILETLPTSQEALPSVLRNSNSKWPVIVGLYFDGGLWKYFLMAPRWVVSDLPREKTVRAGLIGVYYPDGTPAETRNYSYTNQFAWKGFPPSAFAFWLEPKLLFNGTELEASSEPIQGRLRNGVLETNVPFEGKDRMQSNLKTADFALQIPTDGSISPALYELIHRLSSSRLGFADSPELAELHVWFDDAGRPSNTIYTFSEDLTETDAARLLGSYGFSSTRTIILPDGTASIERIALAATGTESIFGTRIDEAGEELDLTKRELRVSVGNTNPVEYPIKSACEPSQPWMRLSGKTLRSIFTSLGWENAPTDIQALQFSEKNGRLVICFE